MSDRNKNNRQNNAKNRTKSAQTGHTSTNKTQRAGKNHTQPQSPEARRRAMRRARQEAKRRTRNSLIIIIGLAGVIIIAVIAGAIKARSASKSGEDTTAQTETTSNLSGNSAPDTKETDTESESLDETDTEAETESEAESVAESDTAESESVDESDESTSDNPDAAGTSASGVTSGSTQGIAIKMNEDTLKKNVTALVRQYRAALATGDTDTLASLFKLDTLKNPTTYTGMAEVITGYQNTECCIMDGMDDTSKVVFIYDDLTLAGIDVAVPNVTAICVRMDASGQLYIDPGTYDEDNFTYQYDADTLAYINNLKGVGDAADLVRKANEKFEEACNTDPQLKQLISDMMNVTDN